MTPRIYVACLKAYNNGKLHGEWIDATYDKDDIMSDITDMLKKSPEYDGDIGDFAIHDHEGFLGYSIGEHTPISEVAKVGELIDEDEEKAEIVLGILNRFGFDTLEEAIKHYDEFFDGIYDSVKEFGEEKIVWLIDEDVYRKIAHYVDTEKYAKELLMSDYDRVDLKDGRIAMVRAY